MNIKTIIVLAVVIEMGNERKKHRKEKKKPKKPK
jgi:hypothetical protein